LLIAALFRFSAVLVVVVVFIDELGVMAKQMEQPASTGGPEVFIVLFQTQTELSFISFFGKVLQQRSSAPARLSHEQRSVTGEACLSADSAEYDVRLLLVETGRHVAGPLALWLLLGSELL